MNVSSVTHLVFLLAWAYLAYEVVRALLKLTGLNKPIAAAAALAVAIAYFLGATGPLAWNGANSADQSASEPAPPPGVAASAPRITFCPRNAIIASQRALGYIDAVGTGLQAATAPKARGLDAPPGAEIHLSGWASLVSGPGKAICVIDNAKVESGPGSYGIFRPDVAAATRIPSNSAAGFSITVKPAPGMNDISVGVLEDDEHTVAQIPGPPIPINVH
jgi:hypothetical protein